MNVTYRKHKTFHEKMTQYKAEKKAERAAQLAAFADHAIMDATPKGTETPGVSKYRGKAKDAFNRGYDAGQEHAQYCVLGIEDYFEAYHDDTLGEILGDIIESYRQFSPFEFTASEFNRARNSETLWKAYDDGEYKGWIEGLAKRFGPIHTEA